MSQKEPKENKERIEKNSDQKHDGNFSTRTGTEPRNLNEVKKNSISGMNVSSVWRSFFETV